MKRAQILIKAVIRPNEWNILEGGLGPDSASFEGEGIFYKSCIAKKAAVEALATSLRCKNGTLL